MRHVEREVDAAVVGSRTSSAVLGAITFMLGCRTSEQVQTMLAMLDHPTSEEVRTATRTTMVALLHRTSVVARTTMLVMLLHRVSEVAQAATRTILAMRLHRISVVLHPLLVDLLTSRAARPHPSRERSLNLNPSSHRRTSMRRWLRFRKASRIGEYHVTSYHTTLITSLRAKPACCLDSLGAQTNGCWLKVARLLINTHFGHFVAGCRIYSQQYIASSTASHQHLEYRSVITSFLIHAPQRCASSSARTRHCKDWLWLWDRKHVCIASLTYSTHAEVAKSSHVLDADSWQGTFRCLHYVLIVSCSLDNLSDRRRII